MSRLFWGGVALLLMTPLGILRATPTVESEKAFVEGLIAEKGELWEKARSYYEEAARSDPGSPALQESLVDMALRTGHFSEALELAQKVVALDPQRAKSHVLLGRLKILKGDISGAVASFRQALTLDPHLPDVQEYLEQVEGLVERPIGPDRPSIKSLRRLIKASPDNPDLHEVLAKVYLARGEKKKAMRELAEVLRLNPAHPEALFHLAALWDERGRFDRAEPLLETLVDQFPDNALGLNFLGYSWADQNRRLPEALQLIQRAVSLEPDNGAFLDSLGWVYFRLSRTTEAVTALGRAALLEKDPLVWEHYGDALQALGSHEEARRSWERGYLLDPGRTSLKKRLKPQGFPRRVAQATGAREFLKEAEGQGHLVKSLAGVFRWHLGDQRGEGVFYFQAPGFFRFESLGPLFFPQAVLIRSDQGLSVSPALPEKLQKVLDEWLGELGGLMSGTSLKVFDSTNTIVSLRSKGVLYRRGDHQLELETPDAFPRRYVWRSSRGTFKIVWEEPLEVEEALLPQKVKGVWPGGALELEWGSLQLNPSLDPALFPSTP